MTGGYYRTKKYEAKVGTATVGTTLASLEAGMQLNFQNRTLAMSTSDSQVKQALDASGVPTIQYPFYLAFGRQMWKAISVRGFSGESMAQLAAVYVAKWVARGLTQAVLQAIRTDVFNVNAPTP